MQILFRPKLKSGSSEFKKGFIRRLSLIWYNFIWSFSLRVYIIQQTLLSGDKYLSGDQQSLSKLQVLFILYGVTDYITWGNDNGAVSSLTGAEIPYYSANTSLFNRPVSIEDVWMTVWMGPGVYVPSVILQARLYKSSK